MSAVGTRKWFWIGALAAAFALSVVLLVPSGRAQAGAFIVDSTIDAIDTNPGDGVCDDGAGLCTLRAAIMEANALAGPDTVALPAGTFTLTLTGPSPDLPAWGDLDITDDLTIAGAPEETTIVDGGAIDRVFSIESSATVSVSRITVRNGLTSGAGGGFALFSGSSLTLTNVVVSGNRSFGNFGGGGIFNSGTLELHGSTVSGTAAGAHRGGGGIANGGTATLSDSMVSENTAVFGGGISNFSGGSVTLTRTTVSNNNSSFRGGGIWNERIFIVQDSTVSGNHADGRGGGIGNGFNTNAVMTLINVTISGNSSGGSQVVRDAGGIGNGGVLSIIGSTITDNLATTGGGGLDDISGSTNLKNTIIANNAAADCAGAITSAGHNLIEDPTGCVISGDTTGNLMGVDPVLGPLVNNGGPTETHGLPPGSPAIDQIPVGDCVGAEGSPLATDQRGVIRPPGPGLQHRCLRA